jgi:hypothetical protein
MKRSDVYKPKIFGVAGLEGRSLTLRVASAALEPLNDPQNGQQEKLVLRFYKTNQALVMSPTRFDDVANFLGDETDGWPGHHVELYVGESGGFACIRVRPPAQAELVPATANPPTRPIEKPANADADMDDDIIPF